MTKEEFTSDNDLKITPCITCVSYYETPYNKEHCRICGDNECCDFDFDTDRFKNVSLDDFKKEYFKNVNVDL